MVPLLLTLLAATPSAHQGVLLGDAGAGRPAPVRLLQSPADEGGGGLLAEEAERREHIRALSLKVVELNTQLEGIETGLPMSSRIMMALGALMLVPFLPALLSSGGVSLVLYGYPGLILPIAGGGLFVWGLVSGVTQSAERKQQRDALSRQREELLLELRTLRAREREAEPVSVVPVARLSF